MAGTDVQLPTTNGTTFVGEQNGDYAGESAISIGDFNGDFIPEVAVAARNYLISVHAGMVAIFKGQPEGLAVTKKMSEADIKIIGDNYSWTGITIFAPGDMDGDRLAEFIFSSGEDFYLLRGTKTPPATITLSSIGSTNKGVKFLGATIFNMSFGDVDGDGIKDLIYTAYSGSSDVFIISGKSIPSNGTLTINNSFFDGVRGYRITLPGVINGSKTSVALTDVDRNGIKDLIITNSTVVKAYVMLNLKSPLPAVTTLSDNYFTGTNGTLIRTQIAVNSNLVHAIGDVNGDSFNDILLSGTQYPNMSDMIMVPGRQTWPATMNLETDTSIKRIRGIGPLNINAIPPVSIAGDHNGDGIQDFIVGDNTKNRAVIIEVGANWPALYTVSNSFQSTNTKLVGPTGTGSSVGFAENLFGGIGCAIDLSYIVGANFGSGIGKAYAVNFKK